MGDYLRYTLFDKYFKTIGCTSPRCPAGTGKDSAHYLLSWYYAWGGALDSSRRLGLAHRLVARALRLPEPARGLGAVDRLGPDAEVGRPPRPTGRPRSSVSSSSTPGCRPPRAASPVVRPTAGTARTRRRRPARPRSTAWATPRRPSTTTRRRTSGSACRRGASSASPSCTTPPATRRPRRSSTSGSPGSSRTSRTDGADWKVPSELTWTGKPDTWNKANPGSNSGLSVAVKSYGQDVGVAGDTARALLFYAAKSGDTASRTRPRRCSTRSGPPTRTTWASAPTETRGDFLRFDDDVRRRRQRRLHPRPAGRARCPTAT